MSKITLKEFRDLTDLFATYYSQKSDNREAGWIEKKFQKYPALKNIWNDFDKKIKAAEKGRTSAIDGVALSQPSLPLISKLLHRVRPAISNTPNSLQH